MPLLVVTVVRTGKNFDGSVTVATRDFAPSLPPTHPRDCHGQNLISADSMNSSSCKKTIFGPGSLDSKKIAYEFPVLRPGLSLLLYGPGSTMSRHAEEPVGNLPRHGELQLVVRPTVLHTGGCLQCP
jgi:hypothetical protein